MKLFLFLILPVVALAASEFCYKDPSCGPDSGAWDGQCQIGKAQSPIDIQCKESSDNRVKDLTTDNIYKTSGAFNIINNGHTVKATLASDKPGFIYGNLFRGKRYIFQELHFHWGSEDNKGSEHTINGKSYAMEGHFVHYSSDYKTFKDAVGSDDPAALAVVGVMFEIRNQNNPALEPFVCKLNQVRTSGTNTTTDKLNLFDMYPNQYKRINLGMGPVVQYSGSLTTPTCNQIVLWTVLPRPSFISPQQIQEFRNLEGSAGPLVDNFRPVLPLNGRSIQPSSATFA